MRSLGIILVIIGLSMLIRRGTSFTTGKEVADLGAVEINQKEKKTFNWPLYGRAIVMVACNVMIASDKRKA